MRSLFAALLALVVLSVSTSATAQAPTPPWIGGAPLRTRVVLDGAGDTWVGVWVDAPVTATARAHVPMAVSLVVDVSGSMAGEKIRNAQMAASGLLESLVDGDIVSIYGFSNGVTEVAAPTVIDASSRAALMQRVGLLVAGGGTNIEGGVRAGVARIAQAPATHPIRRVFLISDGRANIGLMDPQGLGDLAASSTEWGTQLTAIGVGYDYDPSTLSAMAVRSAGRLHHLGTPDQMGPILEQELSWMTRSVALNARLEVRPARGVTIILGATTGAVIEGGVLRFPLGALIAGQRREVLFRVRMDGSVAGRRTLASAELVFDSPEDRSVRTQSYDLTFEIGRSGSEGPETPRVAAMLAQHQASEAERAAARMMAEGRRDEAVAALESARTTLHAETTTYDFEDAEVSGALSAREAELDAEIARSRASTSTSDMRERSYELQAAPMTAEGYSGL
jgi:Ca-activated chloride channel family protein